MNDITIRYLSLINKMIEDKIIKDGKDFALTIGVSVSSITEISKGRSNVGLSAIQKTVLSYPDINLNWLISGEGEIFKTKSIENAYNQNVGNNVGLVVGKRKLQKTPTNAPYSKSDDVHVGMVSDRAASYEIAKRFPLRSDSSVELQRVPLYELEATAGLVGLFLDASNQTPINYISIPDLPRCDGAVHIRGDSMYPLLKSGDIVLYKQVVDFKYLVWGEMYLVSYSVDGDEYVAVKFINKIEGDKENILLVSHNQHHAPAEIPIASIRALALIKASVRYNTMG